ncbi:MAG: aldo/keto reductase [Acidimicrobiales bacterium]|nr:aldo/keto reductase [Acidimicrobiales bacterium]
MPENLVNAEPRPLGPFTVGPLALGLWRFTTESVSDARSLVEHALGAGCNLLDNADVYGLDWGGRGFGSCEALLGKVLGEAPELRNQMVLATKGGIAPPVPYDQSTAYLTAACEASLQRLGVDTIDLYQIHRPDLFAHPAEVAATLGDLRQAGKIREVGVSNFTVPQIEALAAHLDFPLVSLQPQYSAAHLDPLRDGRLDLAMRDDLRPLAWSPLGGGSLVTGEGVRPELVETLDRLAEREGVDRPTVALAFVLAHPSRPVAIMGTQRPERIDAAMRALSITLDRNDCYDLIEGSEGVPLP